MSSENQSDGTEFTKQQITDAVNQFVESLREALGRPGVDKNEALRDHLAETLVKAGVYVGMRNGGVMNAQHMLAAGQAFVPVCAESLHAKPFEVPRELPPLTKEERETLSASILDHVRLHLLAGTEAEHVAAALLTCGMRLMLGVHEDTRTVAVMMAYLVEIAVWEPIRTSLPDIPQA